MKRKIFFIISILLLTFTSAFAREYTTEEAKEIRTAVVAKVKTYIGCPYKTGTTGPDTFDCSGLILSVFQDAAGIQLPRSAKAMYAAVKIVPLEEIEEGDLVFFKTTGDGSISHVGIYIGRKQFIHAASDGSNTGVIVSSLSEKYYKNCYAAVGKPLTSAKKKLTQEEPQPQKNEEQDSSSYQYSSSSDAPSSSSSSSKSSFVSDLTFDGILLCDWSLWSQYSFGPNYRGITYNTFVYYNKNQIQPGLGTGLRWNDGSKVFMIPFYLSLRFNEYINLYGGPAMTFGNVMLPGSDIQIDNAFISGVIGISLNTPSIPIGSVSVSLVQDIVYTIFGVNNGSQLDFGTSLTSGITFSTGLRVTLPMKNVLK